MRTAHPASSPTTARIRRATCSLLVLGAALVVGTGSSIVARADDPSAADLEHFEKKIRPVLVEKCYACHTAAGYLVDGVRKPAGGGLRLDTRDGLRTGGESGPALVPGQPGESLLISALKYQSFEMPPSGKLPEATIADFVRWIERGAPDPRTGTASPAGTPGPRREAFRITDEDRRHWAFQPVRDVPPPAVKDAAWPRVPADRFVLAKIEAEGMSPSPPADRATWLRRVTFDLTGLPPTPDAIRAFLGDASDEAEARVVDRLLASPEHAVHWARHWLDGVRYASDTDVGGRYRDWVVRALHDDVPYDRFVSLQVAGDLLPADTDDPDLVHVSGAALDGIVATGMLSLAIWEQVAVELAVAERVDAQIELVGRHLLGLTLACARCHDHKFDPVSQPDYYALAGIFFSTRVSAGKTIADGRLAADVRSVPLVSRTLAERNAQVGRDLPRLNRERDELLAAVPQAAKLRDTLARLETISKEMTKATGAARTKLDEERQDLVELRMELETDREKTGWSPRPPQLVQAEEIEAKIKEIEGRTTPAPLAIAVQDGGEPGTRWAKIGDAKLLVRGEYKREGPVVPRRLPVVLAGEDQPPIGARTQGSGRLELAQWLVAPDNPLAPRVHVDRVWRHLFGTGLVPTPGNFGRLGQPPTHPELLDHLARRFVDEGWSQKKLIRGLVLSATYRQGSTASPESIRRDPTNRLLARTNRKRLGWEATRDGLLAVGGNLAATEIAARSDGTKSRSTSVAPQSGSGLVPRTLFAPLERRKPDATASAFDGPDPRAVMVERAETTTSTQALYLLNNDFVLAAAQRLAVRLGTAVPEPKTSTSKPDVKKPGTKTDGSRRLDDAGRERAVTELFLIALGRPPREEERAVAKEFLAEGTWPAFCQVVLCANEFVYVD